MLRLPQILLISPFLLPVFVACSSGDGASTASTTGVGGDATTSSSASGAGGDAATEDSIACVGPCPKIGWSRILNGDFDGYGRQLVAIAGDTTIVAYFAGYGGELKGGATPEAKLGWGGIALVTYGPDQSVKRRIDFGDAGDLNAMAAGPDGSVALLVEGRSDSGVTFNGQELPGSKYGEHIVVLKPDGSLGWTGQLSMFDPTIAFGADGSLYAAGRGGMTQGVSDGIVQKLDASGAAVWTKTIKGDVHNFVSATSIAVAPSGDIFVVGYKEDTITIDGTSLGMINRAWLAELSPSDGKAVWAVDVAGTDEPRVRLMGSDPVVVGKDFIERFSGSSAGKLLWQTQIPPKASLAEVAGDTNHLVVTGTFEDGAVFPFGTLERRADNPEAIGAFVAEIDANGTFTRGFGVLPLFYASIPGTIKPLSLAASGTRTVLVGLFRYAIDLGFGRVEVEEEDNEFVLSFGWP